MTDENGKILIHNLKVGKYDINEEKNPNYGYEDNEGTWVTKKVKSGSTTTYNMKNTKQTGNLQIIKEDLDNDNIKLPGVSFKIKYYDEVDEKDKYVRFENSKGEKIDKVTNFEVGKDGTFKLTSQESKGTTFVTGDNGRIQLYNIRTGDYTAIEKNLGENTDYYEIDNNYISWRSGTIIGDGNNCKVTIARRAVGSTKLDTLYVFNKRKYVDLSGYVWEDIFFKTEQEGKIHNSSNGFWKEDGKLDINDKRLQGIKVQLVDATGKEQVKNAETNVNGEYQFKKVEIDKLENYYIEFEYNGMSYQSVAVNINKENGSKASEGGDRETFNNWYQTITYGKSNQYDLTYETSPHESELLYRKDRKVSEYNLGYDGNTEPISNVDSQYIIKANTKNAYGGNLNKIYSADYIRQNNIKEIKNINLGIEKRSKIDLHVEKDIHSVNVSINGTEHVYKHDERFINEVECIENNEEKRGKWYDISPKVKYESEDRYGNMSYTRAVYASDIYYNGGGDENKKLKVWC